MRDITMGKFYGKNKDDAVAAVKRYNRSHTMVKYSVSSVKAMGSKKDKDGYKPYSARLVKGKAPRIANYG